jgi:hypothetical protein
MRLVSRQLRRESLHATATSAARRHRLHDGKGETSQWIAHAIAQALSGHGYSAFVAGPADDTASIQ